MMEPLPKRRAAHRSLVVIVLAVVTMLVRSLPAGAADDSRPSADRGRSEQSPNPNIVAVLFSVSQTENARKQFRDVPNLDLLEIHGAPMIMHVYNALCRSRYIQRVIVVAAPEIEQKLDLGESPATSFLVDRGDAAQNVELGVDEISKGDLVMFIPSDLVLVTPEGLDRLIERVLAQEAVDIIFPIVSRENCERMYPEERRTYARFKEGQYTGAHVEFLRPDLFLDHADEVKANKNNFYDVYRMTSDTLGLVKFLGIKLSLKYVFGMLSPHDIEQHVFEKYSVTAKTIYWDDPDLSTDLSEPKDIQMIERVLQKRGCAGSNKVVLKLPSRAGTGQRQ